MPDITDESFGPRELEGHVAAGFGDIEADIDAMEEFAKRLAGEIQSGYAPHLAIVSDAMMTELPPPAGYFNELYDFMTAHHAAQEATHNNVYNFADGTQRIATAAETISHEYRGSDAFSRARVSDVDKAFTQAARPEGGGQIDGGA